MASHGVVCHVDMVGSESMIVYSHLDSEQADEAIREQTAYFDSLGHTVEWKVYAHDTPADLHDRLLATGFESEDEEAIMVLDLDDTPQALLEAPSCSIRRVHDSEALGEVIAVSDEVWHSDHASLGQRLAFQLRAAPDHLSVYVAYVDGVPAGTARIEFHENSTFASHWGGATLPAYRHRGLYTGLLAVRVQEARRHGARFLTIDAGPMSRPIVERFGFRVVSHACAHVRRPSSHGVLPDRAPLDILIEGLVRPQAVCADAL